MIFNDFDRMVFFGDSLTDAGAVHDWTSQLLAIPFPVANAGYDGVLSNGPVYSQLLPQLLAANSTVYGVGGARAIGERSLAELLGLGSATPPFDPASLTAQLVLPGADLSLLATDINLGGQLGRFLADEAAAPADDVTVASFLIGLNDFNAIDPTSPDLEAEAVATLQGVLASTLAAAQAAVAQGGVDGLVFYGFPTVDFIPAAATLGPEAQAAFADLAAQHEAALKIYAGLFGAAGVPARVVELDQISAEIDADMGTFGFLAKGPVLFGAATNPLVGPPVPPSPLPTLFFPENPAVADLPEDQVQFYDFLHPTTALHGVFAAFSAASITKTARFLDDTDNFVPGLRGDDLVLAKGGDDVVLMGRGDDVGFGGLGDDHVSGGRGDDVVAGGSGSDLLRGGRDDDLLSGGAGDDRIFGGKGDDLLIGGHGSDLVSGGRGCDVFVWTEEALTGGSGGARDRVLGGSGDDALYLVLPEETAAAVALEIDGRNWLEKALGVWDLDSIGVTVIGVEEVCIVDGLDGVGKAAPDLLAQADLWGFV